MKISLSMLIKAMNCRLSFLWAFQGPPEAIDPMPMKKRAFIGHILQRAVERFYKDKFYKHAPAVTSLMYDAIDEAAVQQTKEEGILWDAGEQEGWIATAKESVPQIISVIKAERLLVPGVEAEYSVSANFGTHTVYGRLDFLYPLDTGLVILDGKGGKSYGKYTVPNQLLFYGLGLLADAKYLKFPDRLGFWWYRHTKIQWRKFPLEARQEFTSDVIITLNKLEVRDYTPEPGGHCRLCDFNLQCAAGRKYINSRATVITDLDIPDNANFVSLD